MSVLIYLHVCLSRSLPALQDTLLYGYFGMLTDFCWRRSSQELQPIPDGVCFCDIKQKAISQGGERTPAVIREVGGISPSHSYAHYKSATGTV